MSKKVRLIYTVCHQTGVDRYDQGFVTVDAIIDLPEKINGRPLKEYSFVGLEFLPEKEE